MARWAAYELGNIVGGLQESYTQKLLSLNHAHMPGWRDGSLP